MHLSAMDIGLFVAFFAVTLGTSMFKSRKEATGEDFFLAGRSLVWPIIGLSLIAANISSEQFVGMAGQAAGTVGLAIASYEWIAAITLVIVAIFFLPKFLKSGIYTIPEYLEYRYNSASRGIMAFYTMVIYVCVSLAAVIYSGAVALHVMFDIKMLYAILLIGGIATVYSTWGGLKAVAWADIFQGTALILGGALTMILGFKAVGGVDKFFEFNADKLHMVLPKDHPVLPWTALVVGLWIPNFYYWGLNQFIAQRALAAKTLKEGQLGIIFCAGLKLIIPFVIVFPGIMAYQLFQDKLGNTDDAYPLLIREIIPNNGLLGFIFAAISGAIISTLASLLNSASTIFTMDLYKRHLRKKMPSPKSLLTMGRIATVIFVIAGCLIATQLGNPKFKGIYTYIQEFQGYISPGILAAFVFGMVFKKAPAAAGPTALLLCVPVYGFLHWYYGSEMAFLNRMAITFGVIMEVMLIMTALKPLPEPKAMPVRADFDMRPAKSVVWLGVLIIAATVALYIIFW